MMALVLSILVLLAGFTTAMAVVTIDFSGYSLEELLEISSDLADEIASRPGGEKIVLGAGQYKIGESLPAGVYSFKFVQNGDSDVSRTDYYVYESESCTNTILIGYGLVTCPEWRGTSWVMVKRGSAFIPVNT